MREAVDHEEVEELGVADSELLNLLISKSSTSLVLSGTNGNGALFITHEVLCISLTKLTG